MKKFTKRSLSLILALVLIVSSMATIALARNVKSSDRWYSKVLSVTKTGKLLQSSSITIKNTS